MPEWKNLLRADPTQWLLEEDNPSVRYFTLTDILEHSHSDPVAKRARKEIMKNGIAPGILSKQQSAGYWGVADDFYIRSKYRGTVWQIIILAELGVDGADERIKKACEFIIENSQDRESGGFSYLRAEAGGGVHSAVLPCLTGNMVWSLIRLGNLLHPAVKRGINWIAKYQRFDDRAKSAPEGWPYDKMEKCWGKHTCHMGAVKALKALAEIPEEKRNGDVKSTIERGVEHLLKHHIHKRSHNLSKVSKQSWLKFGFPNMYQTDVLEITGILTKLGCIDTRMQEAIDLIISRQDAKGRWKLESTFNGRFLFNIEQKNRPSKWITLNALRVLKRFYS